METLFILCYYTCERKFKSYYVVWKHKQTNQKCESVKRLNRTMQYGNECGGNMCRHLRLRLNRTMQYGNDRNISQGANNSQCLNRTMQYGNS